MMNRNDQDFIVRKIRSQYMGQPSTELDALRALDKRVRRPATVFAYIFGTISSLVMGAGMSFAMNVIEPGTYFGITVGEDMMIPGIIIGLFGILACVLTYPLYKAILGARRARYAPEIMALSEQALENR